MDAQAGALVSVRASKQVSFQDVQTHAIEMIRCPGFIAIREIAVLTYPTQFDLHLVQIFYCWCWFSATYNYLHT